MANQEHIEWFRKGVTFWNKTRGKPDFQPDFSNANLSSLEFRGPLYKEGKGPLSSVIRTGMDLRYGDFRNANLNELDLRAADLESAWLQESRFFKTNLRYAELGYADFSRASLRFARLDNVKAVNANFTAADLYRARLQNGEFNRANLTDANLEDAKLDGADFSNAILTGTNITGARPWTAILYPELADMEACASDLLKEVKNIGDLVNMCQLLESHYKDNSEESYFNEGFRFYFRGQSVSSWELRPSIMRNSSEGATAFRNREGEMLLDLMSQRPEDFLGVTSALSQWVIAQQHGLKTRLLDITRNSLVALFHACETPETGNDSNDEDGVLHVFIVPKCLVKTYDSDAVSVIANLAKLPRFEQDILMGKLVDGEESSRRENFGYPIDYSRIMGRLYHYIGQEKPHFRKRIDLKDLFRVFVVEPQQSFERIRVQSGAFLVSAFHERFETEKVLALTKNVPLYHHYKLTVPSKSKRSILQDLRFLNMTREVLFPGLDEAAAAIVERNQG